MNKRHLFRGKRLDNKKWIIGCPADERGRFYIFDTVNGFLNEIGEIDPNTLGQCTGLLANKSFRGEKPEDLLMFDGDLIYDSDLEFYGVVQFCEDTMAWMVCVPEAQTGDREWLEQFIDSKTGTASTTKIVGIIYDMPELPEGIEEAMIDD